MAVLLCRILDAARRQACEKRPENEPSMLILTKIRQNGSTWQIGFGATRTNNGSSTMARYKFREGKTYAARLQGIHERPIENSRVSGVRLLRLEFEVFEQIETKSLLSSTGKIACRDIVVGRAVEPSRDSSVTAYALALRVPKPSSVTQWLQVSDRQAWVKIVFGAKGPDMRNSFDAIFPFDAEGWQVQPYDYNLDKEWVAVSEAGDDLGCSESTIRRRVDEFERIWGTELVRRTEGNQRRIRLSLLRNLWAE